MRGLLFAALAGPFLRLLDGPMPPPDPCSIAVPSAVKRAVIAENPGSQLPRLSDNMDGDVEYDRTHGGDGCLGATNGDFDGDGVTDYGLLLSSGDQTVLVSVLGGSGERWLIHRLRAWKGGRSRLFVGTAPPGHYSRTESHAGPLGIGEVTHHTTKTSGIVTGRTEASGIYYFWTGGEWVHVWAVD